MILTETMFKALFPGASLELIAPLNRTMARYGIDSTVRSAAFLAQIGHESNGLKVFVENLNYSAIALAATWPARFRDVAGKPNPLALNLHRKPEAIANHVYADRMGNGGIESGDGWKYRGRGAIQTTGRANYAKLAATVGVDVVAKPELLEKPEMACLSAGHFWNTRNLNDLADVGKFEAITKAINGGTNGFADRVDRWELAKRIIGERR